MDWVIVKRMEELMLRHALDSVKVAEDLGISAPTVHRFLENEPLLAANLRLVVQYRDQLEKKTR
jgi:hypothetical protein